MAEDIPLIVEEIAENLATIEEEAVSESLPAEETEAQSAKPAELEKEETQSAPAELPLIREPKRKPGRPAGSKNKQPAKPRAKRVVMSEAFALQPPPPPAPSPAPRWDAQHQLIPTEAKTEMAELMLRLLSGQAMERQRRKDERRRARFS